MPTVTNGPFEIKIDHEPTIKRQSITERVMDIEDIIKKYDENLFFDILPRSLELDLKYAMNKYLENKDNHETLIYIRKLERAVEKIVGETGLKNSNDLKEKFPGIFEATIALNKIDKKITENQIKSNDAFYSKDIESPYSYHTTGFSSKNRIEPEEKTAKNDNESETEKINNAKDALIELTNPTKFYKLLHKVAKKETEDIYKEYVVWSESHKKMEENGTYSNEKLTELEEISLKIEKVKSIVDNTESDSEPLKIALKKFEKTIDKTIVEARIEAQQQRYLQFI